MPERIQRKRTKDWHMPDGAIYVGRPTRWGNPYRASWCRRLECDPRRDAPPMHWHVADPDGEYAELSAATKPRDQAEAVQLAVRYHAMLVDDDYWLALIQLELGGHDLACWCPTTQPCHADTLLAIANTRPEETQ